MTINTWTVTIEEAENGDAILPLPQDMIDELGWITGDMLDLQIDETNGTLTLVNISSNDRKLLIV